MSQSFDSPELQVIEAARDQRDGGQPVRDEVALQAALARRLEAAGAGHRPAPGRRRLSRPPRP